MIRTPLFWDLHIHGAAGVDFMRADPDGIVHACEVLGRHGIGFFAPTLLTAEMGMLRDACRVWGKVCRRVREQPSWLARTAAQPVGIHLEGPFLSPRFAGAHPRAFLARGNGAHVFEDLLAAAQGEVAIVTLAPELPGALVLIRWLASRGVRVQLGHTEATTAQAHAAARAGARGITHLYNAMRIHHRDPGCLGALARGTLTAELITDGVHLDPDFILWCWRAAPSHVYAVSDGCCAMGARPSHRPLTLGSLVLKKRGPVAVVASTGVLAGGATFLTEHPKRLAAKLPDKTSFKQLLALFHRLQPALLSRRWPRNNPRRDHFDPRTLRFLGTE